MKINIKSLKFKSCNEETTISAVAYFPDDVPVRAIVQVVHGVGDAISYYRDFMLYLAEQGFAVFGHDQLGHGTTALSPEDYGFFAQENGHIALVRDVRRLSKIAGDMFPDKKLFLLGHSMGSMVARLYALKYGEQLAGLVLLGPPGPQQMTALGMLVAQRTIKKEGPRHRPIFLDRLTFGAFSKKVVPQNTPRDWLSRDEAHIRRVIGDPARSFRLTAAGFRDVYSLSELSNSKKWAESFPKGLPTLMLSGDCDPVSDFGRGGLQIYNRLLSAGVSDLSFELYAGARHELLNEINRDEVFADILAWIQARI